MGRKHYRGIQLPEAGDSILDSLAGAADTAGVVTVAASVAEARVILTQATANGSVVSPGRPVYFDILGVVYRADGTKRNNVWQLAPINMQERVRANRGENSGVKRTLAQGQEINVITTTLDARPYDRAISLQALVYGSMTGTVWMRVYPPGEPYVSARFSTDDVQSNFVPARGRIAAGTSPEIRVTAVGGYGGGTITFGNGSDNTLLFIDAFPDVMN